MKADLLQVNSTRQRLKIFLSRKTETNFSQQISVLYTMKAKNQNKTQIKKAKHIGTINIEIKSNFILFFNKFCYTMNIIQFKTRL